MKLNGMNEVYEFKKIIENARGSVWAEDGKGASYDLKDEMSQYVVIGKLLSRKGEGLEFFATDYNDGVLLGNFVSRSERLAA